MWPGAGRPHTPVPHQRARRPQRQGGVGLVPNDGVNAPHGLRRRVLPEPCNPGNALAASVIRDRTGHGTRPGHTDTPADLGPADAGPSDTPGPPTRTRRPPTHPPSQLTGQSRHPLSSSGAHRQHAVRAVPCPWVDAQLIAVRPGCGGRGGSCKTAAGRRFEAFARLRSPTQRSPQPRGAFAPSVWRKTPPGGHARQDQDLAGSHHSFA
jgi:hypothetical protein